MASRLRKSFLQIVAATCAAAPAVVSAHEIESQESGPFNTQQLWRTWGWDPATWIGLLLSATLYGWGLYRLWRSAGVGHGIRRSQAACFLFGWMTLFVALVSPLHPLGQVLFSAHMAQHELLMLLAAPLLVLSQPMAGILRGLPSRLSSSLGRLSNAGLWRTAWRFISLPLVAWLIHAVVLWMWHAPRLFQATLHSEWVHAAQHLSFLLSSLLFWWSLIHGKRATENYGAAVLYLFTTAIHSGLLGALLTFARIAWYPDYDQTNTWGLSGLEDQQIGGLIMWVPACTVYIVAALVMVASMLRHSGPTPEGAVRKFAAAEQ